MEIRYIDYGERVGALKPLSRPSPPFHPADQTVSLPLVFAERKVNAEARERIYIVAYRTRAHVRVRVCRNCVYTGCVRILGVVAL